MSPYEQSDLDSASSTIDGFSDRIDFASKWNGVLEAAERRRRRHVASAIAVGSIVALVALGSLAYFVHVGDRASTVRVSAAKPGAETPTSCVLPSFPSSSSGHRVLSGPAVELLQGGAARGPFELDNGLIRVSPPGNAAPSITANEAECAALASRESAGPWLLQLASTNGGTAVGYGFVSIAPEAIQRANETPFLEGNVNENTHAILPPATQYQRRLAWVVVVSNSQSAGGDLDVPVPDSTALQPNANDLANYHYAVFVVDARTGSDALIYTEPMSANQPAAVVVPPESVSVPWRLIARDPDGHSGTIEARVLPCDGVPSPVSVGIEEPELRVVVERPVGPSCGSEFWRQLPIRASIATSRLPDAIAHGALGPDVLGN